MKNSCWITLVFTLLTASVWAKDQGHGRVSMLGQIQASACSIDTDDVWQEIAFGEVPLRSVTDGLDGMTKSFSVRLVNCRLEKADGSFWRGVNMTFAGEPVTGRSDLFAISGEARGVGLMLTDAQGTQAQPGKPLPEVALAESRNTLDYRLSLVRDGAPIEEGDWAGVIRFMVDWQ